ncbi:MAG: VOC family protein [Egibacteraceae bacterium]
MATRLDAVTVETADPGRVGRFWADALGWSMLDEQPGSVTVGVPGADVWGDGGPVRLVFLAATTPKSAKNGLHLDLASATLADQRATVERLQALGARRVDIGQEATPWVVMADPDGNELCVLDPRQDYVEAGPIAAVLVDCSDAIALANFWIKATAWPALRYSDGYAALRHARQPTTWFELLEVPDHTASAARVHLDVVTGPDRDLPDEVARLEAAGARRLPEGPRCWDGHAPPTTQADPQGTVFCVRQHP